jgi:hypothetical protein
MCTRKKYVQHLALCMLDTLTVLSAEDFTMVKSIYPKAHDANGTRLAAVCDI